jgi:hypothetical protein
MRGTLPIPANLQEKLTAIDREVFLLHFKWTYLKQLFGTENRVAVLNATASSLFSAIEEMLFNDIFLSLLRLIDPPASLNRHSNLCLRSVAAEIPDQALKEQVEGVEVEIRAKAGDIKITRDKKLAHNDLLQHLKKSDPIPPIQIKELTDALALVRQALNLIHGHFFDREVLYEKCVTENDGNSLLFYLDYGLQSWTEDKAKEDFSRAKTWRSEP